MSDLMFYGVLRMPYEMAMSDELSRRQFYSRAQEAADRVERLEAAATAPKAAVPDGWRNWLPPKYEAWQDHFGVQRSAKSPDVISLIIERKEIQLYYPEFAYLLEKMLSFVAAATPSPVPADTAELPPLPEPFEINWPELNSSALGCGVEDRGIRDRYDAAAYGWEDGVGRAIERVPEEIYTADQMRDYARATLASRPAPVAAMTVEQARRTGYGEGVRRAAQLVEQAIDNEGRMALAARIRDLQSAAPAAPDERSERPSAAQAAGVELWREIAEFAKRSDLEYADTEEWTRRDSGSCLTIRVPVALLNRIREATTPSEGVAAPVEQPSMKQAVAKVLADLKALSSDELRAELDKHSDGSLAVALREASEFLYPAQPSADQKITGYITTDDLEKYGDGRVNARMMWVYKEPRPDRVAISVLHTTASGEKGADRG